MTRTAPARQPAGDENHVITRPAAEKMGILIDKLNMKDDSMVREERQETVLAHSGTHRSAGREADKVGNNPSAAERMDLGKYDF